MSLPTVSPLYIGSVFGVLLYGMNRKKGCRNLHHDCKQAMVKARSKSYDDLLKDFKIPTHEKRRSDARLVILFKIIRKYCYFPGNIFNFIITLPLHHNLLWNQLNSTTVSASSVQSFEYLLRQYT